MSKATSIRTINDDLAGGAVIQAFEGTLTHLYEMRKIGEGNDAWTKQNGKLKDKEGEIIEVEFRRNHEEVPASWKGKYLRFESVKGDRGTHGVKVHDDEYKGKTTRKLIITASAEVVFPDGSAPAAKDETWRHGEKSQSTASQPPAKSQPSSGSNKDLIPTSKLRKGIVQRATVWLHCYDTAVAAASLVGEKHRFAMVPQAIGALTASLYIDTMRELGSHGIAAVDTSAFPWANAKGKTMEDAMRFLDEQVQATAAARMPKPPANTSMPMEYDDSPRGKAAGKAPDPDWPEAPPPANTQHNPLDDEDEIPF